MSGYKCQYCGKVSGTTRNSATGKEKPAMSDNGCLKAPSKKHKWIKK